MKEATQLDVSTELSRRDFLRLSALAGAGTVLAACLPEGPATQPDVNNTNPSPDTGTGAVQNQVVCENPLSGTTEVSELPTVREYSWSDDKVKITVVVDQDIDAPFVLSVSRSSGNATERVHESKPFKFAASDTERVRSAPQSSGTNQLIPGKMTTIGVFTEVISQRPDDEQEAEYHWEIKTANTKMDAVVAIIDGQPVDLGFVECLTTSRGLSSSVDW